MVLRRRNQRHYTYFDGKGLNISLASLICKPKDGDQLEVIIQKLLRKTGGQIQEIRLPGSGKFVYKIANKAS
jgi:hypothetical protein